MRRLSIARFMTPDPVTLSPGEEITRASAVLVAWNISGAPVADDTGRLVGMLSNRDCFRAVLHAHYHQEPGETVARYMTPKVETLDADLDIIAAAEAFIRQGYRRFPVLEDGRLVGILSRKDLLRAFQSEGES